MIQIGKKYPLSEAGYDLLQMWNGHGGNIQMKSEDKVIVLQRAKCNMQCTKAKHHQHCDFNNKVSIKFPDGQQVNGVPICALDERETEKNVLGVLSFHEKLIAFENSPEPENWGD